MRAVCLTLLLSLLAGCKTVAPAVQLEDVSPARAKRKQDVVKQFEADQEETQFHAALKHWEQGNLPACEQQLTAILSRQKDHQSAALLLAEVKLASDQPAQAAELLERTRTEADRVSAAVLALKYNHPQVAVQLLHQAAENPAPTPAALRTLGVAYYRCGDYEQAEATLRQALALDNSSGLSYFLLGCTQARLGRKAMADEAFQQAARLDGRLVQAR